MASRVYINIRMLDTRVVWRFLTVLSHSLASTVYQLGISRSQRISLVIICNRFLDLNQNYISSQRRL